MQNYKVHTPEGIREPTTEEAILITSVQNLALEDPADRKTLSVILDGRDPLENSSFNWFQTLLNRGGRKFDQKLDLKTPPQNAAAK